MQSTSISVFWFRRDLRLEDNTALSYALNSGNPVLPIFIFDDNILNELPTDDSRVTFIYETLSSIDKKLKLKGSSLYCIYGDPLIVWQRLITEFKVIKVFFNKDYEPYSIKCEIEISNLLRNNGIEVFSYKDQVIFEEREILKNDGLPYTMFTPYKNKWLLKFDKTRLSTLPEINSSNFIKFKAKFQDLSEFGFTHSTIVVRPFQLDHIKNYSEKRNFPAADSTSFLGPHLRFGTLSIRSVVLQITEDDWVFLNELIWREFFMQILFHFPNVVDQNFRSKYNGIIWRNNEEEFLKWSRGETGYSLVDAGMRQLNSTGYLHNRVRMVAAGFLCKHLLIDWRWGEAYFAEKLVDFELSSNNGNWQWAAGTGCDAAPYFRIFNPIEQQKKFDKDFAYIQKWLPEFNSAIHPKPLVEHSFARSRALEAYRKALLEKG